MIKEFDAPIVEQKLISVIHCSSFYKNAVWLESCRKENVLNESYSTERGDYWLSEKWKVCQFFIKF